MTVKVYFASMTFAIVIIFVIQKVLADPALCPEPSDANQLVYKQNVREPAPDFGRIGKDYFLAKPDKDVTCITISGTATGSIASIGFSDKGIKVNLVSGIKEGFDAVLEVYSK